MLFAFASTTTSFLAGSGPLPRTVSTGATVRMTVTAEPEAAKSAELLYDLNEPVFPEVCEFAGVTLSRYVLEMARANPDKP